MQRLRVLGYEDSCSLAGLYHGPRDHLHCWFGRLLVNLSVKLFIEEGNEFHFTFHFQSFAFNAQEIHTSSLAVLLILSIIQAFIIDFRFIFKVSQFLIDF